MIPRARPDKVYATSTLLNFGASVTQTPQQTRNVAGGRVYRGLVKFRASAMQRLVDDGVERVLLALPCPDADDAPFGMAGIDHVPVVLQVPREPKRPILAADADAHGIT